MFNESGMSVGAMQCGCSFCGSVPNVKVGITQPKHSQNVGTKKPPSKGP